MEKGYRYYGTDLTPGDTPDEAGLAFCVDMATDFTGREALAARREQPPLRRIRTLLVGGRDYLTVYGGEAVHHDGAVVGRLRSAAYGFTVGRNLAYAYLPVELGPGDTVGVEIFGELVEAEVADDVQYDPGNERVRASMADVHELGRQPVVHARRGSWRRRSEAEVQEAVRAARAGALRGRRALVHARCTSPPARC